MQVNKRNFPELAKLNYLAKYAKKLVDVEVLTEVSFKGSSFPIYAFSFGRSEPGKPVFIVSAGVHGLEKVGTHLAIYQLRTFLSRMRWDADFRNQFQRMRFCFIPLVNPVGMLTHRRSNGQGVDLMRNGPIEADDAPKLVGGHRLGPWLPWFRGYEGQGMESEAQAVVDFCWKQIADAPVSMTIDLHSGFGMKDRLWYPYAKTKSDFINKQEALRVVRLLNRTLPYHIYKIEAQSESYTTHGDLWDYLHLMHTQRNHGKKLYLPWTLEMGSWLWVRKNPLQVFSLLGGFNPVLPHRYRRTMRRHTPLFDFFMRSLLNYTEWYHPV